HPGRVGRLAHRLHGRRRHEHRRGRPRPRRAQAPARPDERRGGGARRRARAGEPALMRWLRFARGPEVHFGFVEGAAVHVCRGEPFGACEPTAELLPLEGLAYTIPCAPSKVIALVGNFGEGAADPLFFIKSPNALAPHGAVVPAPRSYTGRVLFEGELGVVIGKPGRDIAPEAAADHIFGYTCVNDVTAIDLLKADPNFPQWTRAKGFDGFGPFGPIIATGLDPATLVVRTIVNGRERQSYRVAELVLGPAQLVSLLSRDMTLRTGDVIACGTGPGAGVLKP